jgi:hypothetical protein
MLDPTRRNDAPSMKSELATMAPAMDAFTSVYLPGAQRGHCNHQLGQVSECGVQQAANRVARLRRHRLGGVAEQRGQRDDGEDGQQEEPGVRVRCERLRGEHDGNEDEEPKQGRVTDLVEQKRMGFPPRLRTSDRPPRPPSARSCPNGYELPLEPLTAREVVTQPRRACLQSLVVVAHLEMQTAAVGGDRRLRVLAGDDARGY